MAFCRAITIGAISAIVLLMIFSALLPDDLVEEILTFHEYRDLMQALKRQKATIKKNGGGTSAEGAASSTNPPKGPQQQSPRAGGATATGGPNGKGGASASASAAGVAKDPVRKQHGERMLALAASINTDIEQFRTVVNHPHNDPNYANDKGCALFLIVGHAQNPKSLAMLDVMLSHPLIDPNGDVNAWSPLKSAISKGHRHMVERLIQHPKTIPQVHVTGLKCSDVIYVPKTVALIVPTDAHTCFRNHPLVFLPDDPRILRRKGQGESPIHSEDALTAAATGRHNGVAKAAPPVELGPSPILGGSLAVNPHAFKTLWEASWFYFTGNARTSVTVITIAVCGSHFGILFLASVLSLWSQARDRRDAAAQEAAQAAAADAAGRAAAEAAAAGVLDAEVGAPAAAAAAPPAAAAI